MAKCHGVRVCGVLIQYGIHEISFFFHNNVDKSINEKKIIIYHIKCINVAYSFVLYVLLLLLLWYTYILSILNMNILCFGSKCYFMLLFINWRINYIICDCEYCYCYHEPNAWLQYWWSSSNNNNICSEYYFIYGLFMDVRHISRIYIYCLMYEWKWMEYRC